MSRADVVESPIDWGAISHCRHALPSTALLKPSVAFAAISVLVVAIVGKFLGVYLGSRLCRLGHWEAVAVGSALNSRGVVEIVIAMAGLRLGIISSEMFSIIVLVAVVTSLMAPPLLRAAVARIHSPDEERRKHTKYTAMNEPSIP
ncbi:cation:proton antiporter [Rhodococcus sp. NPDC080181]|uniref:cation:proton antiporter n=1 Tax=Rhodococcus sp. NPDC080181 TaxID=3155292 RepID=UPI00344C45DA